MGLYSAAQISQKYGFPEIYDAGKQISLQTDIVGYQFPVDQTSYFTHPPFILLLVNPIAHDPYLRSLMYWSGLLLLLNGLITCIFIKSLADCKFSRGETWTLAFGIFLFWPTFSGFMNGQDVLILLLGTSMWMLQMISGNLIGAGLGLGLSVIRPQMAIFLAVPFLLRKQKVLLGFIVAAGILTLLSLALIGSSGLHKYTNILGVVEGAMWRLPHSKDMPTISGFIRRNFSAVNKEWFGNIIWGGFIAGLGAVSLWWKRNSEIGEREIGLLILIALIFVPYAHYHELALLLIPTICLIRIFHIRGLISKEILCIFPLLISLVLMIGFIGSGSIKYSVVYLVMSISGYLLVFPEKITALSFFQRR